MYKSSSTVYKMYQMLQLVTMCTESFPKRIISSVLDKLLLARSYIYFSMFMFKFTLISSGIFLFVRIITRYNLEHRQINENRPGLETTYGRLVQMWILRDRLIWLILLACCASHKWSEIKLRNKVRLLRGHEEFCIFSADGHKSFRLPGSELQFLLKLSSFQFFIRTVSTEDDILMLGSDLKNWLHKPYLERLLANAFPGIL